MIDWQTMDKAPMNGADVLICDERGRYHIGSYRCDANDFDGSEGPLWLDNSYNDFSCGYASVPLKPKYWAALTVPAQAGAA